MRSRLGLLLPFLLGVIVAYMAVTIIVITEQTPGSVLAALVGIVHPLLRRPFPENAAIFGWSLVGNGIYFVLIYVLSRKVIRRSREYAGVLKTIIRFLGIAVIVLAARLLLVVVFEAALAFVSGNIILT